MRIFLILKIVTEKIANFFIRIYETILDKIAIHSRIYKSLYNRFELDIESHERLKEFVDMIEDSKATNLLTSLYRSHSIGWSEKYDYQVARLSEPTDLMIVSSEIEKEKVKETMKISSGAGEIFTIEEILDKDIPAHVGVYIFSSVWIKDQTKLVNLLYKINSNKEKYLL